MAPGYSISTGFFAEGVRYMFHPDFGELSAQGMLVALGHAFFTLSVGMGAVMAYGAYLPEGTSIVSTSVAVVIADTTIALLAGLVIFPIVFANGLDPGAGPGLLFKTLPVAFGQMTLGAGVGFYDVSNLTGSDYFYWQLGVTRPFGIVDMDLRYFDTSDWVPIVSTPGRAEARIVLSARIQF